MPPGADQLGASRNGTRHARGLRRSTSGHGDPFMRMLSNSQCASAKGATNRWRMPGYGRLYARWTSSVSAASWWRMLPTNRGWHQRRGLAVLQRRTLGSLLIASASLWSCVELPIEAVIEAIWAAISPAMGWSGVSSAGASANGLGRETAWGGAATAAAGMRAERRCGASTVRPRHRFNRGQGQGARRRVARRQRTRPRSVKLRN